ncbi:MAG: hypothetical protein ACLT98_06035 [Eggerthellaceae bacterium]
MASSSARQCSTRGERRPDGRADRLFYAARHGCASPAAVACAPRRHYAAIDQIKSIFRSTACRYRPTTALNFGRSVEDVRQDAEGLQIMRVLGTNMA